VLHLIDVWFNKLSLILLILLVSAFKFTVLGNYLMYIN